MEGAGRDSCCAGLAGGRARCLAVDEGEMTPRLMAALLVIASSAAPENPPAAYLIAVVEICADIYGVDPIDCRCIVGAESEWNPKAIGDNGEAIGLWQWHEGSIRFALRDMGIVWDWDEEDPRLNVWVSTLAAGHAMSKGWDWWTTREICEELVER